MCAGDCGDSAQAAMTNKPDSDGSRFRLLLEFVGADSFYYELVGKWMDIQDFCLMTTLNHFVCLLTVLHKKLSAYTIIHCFLLMMFGCFIDLKLKAIQCSTWHIFHNSADCHRQQWFSYPSPHLIAPSRSRLINLAFPPYRGIIASPYQTNITWCLHKLRSSCGKIKIG